MTEKIDEPVIEIDMELDFGADGKQWIGYLKCPTQYAPGLPEYLRVMASHIESKYPRS